MSINSLEIHFYGTLKRIVDPEASMAEDTIKFLEYKENETLIELLDRLAINPNDCRGDCFINGVVSPHSARIPKPQNKNTRVALFPLGMHLLCGGQHLKGHGFITKRINKENKYY